MYVTFLLTVWESSLQVLGRNGILFIKRKHAWIYVSENSFDHSAVGEIEKNQKSEKGVEKVKVN